MGAYSGFDIDHKESSINSDFLSAYVDVAGRDPAPAQQTISTQPASEFELLPDDEPTPFDEPATTAAPSADTPVPAAAENTAAPKEDTKASEDTGKDQAEQDEAAKKKAHEEAEAKRKAEFDARQAEKKAAEQAQIDKIAAMSEEELMTASMKRVSADTEKLTRRNMKECVSEYIQTMCLDDPAFARMVMHPRKSMIRCFQYINRKAREYIEQEMKDNDIRPQDVNGVYGSDVPDDLCYQWGVDYFRNPDAKEDHRDDEKFVPKPYVGGRSSSKAKSKPKDKKPAEKKTSEKPKKAPAPAEASAQISLMEMAS